MWLSPDPGEAKGISLPHLERYFRGNGLAALRAHARSWRCDFYHQSDEMAWSAELPRIVRVDSRATDVPKRPLASS